MQREKIRENRDQAGTYFDASQIDRDLQLREMTNRLTSELIMTRAAGRHSPVPSPSRLITPIYYTRQTQFSVGTVTCGYLKR